ncbi:MAG: hypothetical protein ABUL73_00335 [Alphaproteobacteria bacterium]
MNKTPDAKTNSPQRGAYLGLLGVCVVIAAIGIALDFVANKRASFWLLGLPGGRALIGLAAAVFAVGAGWLARLFLARPMAPKEASHAGDHA